MNQKGFVNIILIIAVIVLVGIGGYFAFTKKSEPISQQPSPTPAQTNTTATTQAPKDETATWNTYKDDQFGYEVKYPKGYVVYKYVLPCGSGWDNTKGQNVIIWNEEFLQSHDISKNWLVDFDIYIHDPDDKCVSGHYSSPGGPGAKTYKLLGSENIVVNGYNVLKRNYIDLPPAPETVSSENYEQDYPAFKFSTWRFERNGTYSTLLYNNGVTVDPAKQIDLFQKFLSTFRFNR